MKINLFRNWGATEEGYDMGTIEVFFIGIKKNPPENDVAAFEKYVRDIWNVWYQQDAVWIPNDFISHLIKINDDDSSPYIVKNCESNYTITLSGL